MFSTTDLSASVGKKKKVYYEIKMHGAMIKIIHSFLIYQTFDLHSCHISV
jgi:hypothetical protein